MIYGKVSSVNSKTSANRKNRVLNLNIPESPFFFRDRTQKAQNRCVAFSGNPQVLVSIEFNFLGGSLSCDNRSGQAIRPKRGWSLQSLSSAIIETSAVIVYLWECYASLGVSHTPSAHLKTAIHKNNNRRRA